MPSILRSTLARLGGLALLAASVAAPAVAAPDPPPFFADWRRALAQPGGEAIADLTAFPFRFEGRPLERAAFVSHAVPALFTPAARRCLQRARPVAEADGRWVVSCAPYGYVFAPAASGWRLIEFFADMP